MAAGAEERLAEMAAAGKGAGVGMRQRGEVENRKGREERGRRKREKC